MTCPAPYRCRRWSSRTTAESSFWAGTVPSHVCGGAVHVSQLPQAARVLPEVREQLDPAALDGLAQREHRVEVLPEPAAVRGVALGGLDHPALLDDVGEPVGQPGGRRARRPGRRGRSPGSSPRRTSAGPGARPSAPTGGRCPCRTRSCRPSPGRARAGTGTGCSTGPRRGGPRGRAGRRCRSWSGRRRSARPTCARGSRRCRRRRGARCAAGRAAAPAGCPWGRCGTRCSAGRSWRRTGARRSARAGPRSPRAVAAVAVAVRAIRGTSGQRCPRTASWR